ncbi:unnamed protein product [Phytophthora fragariaefolia]|uniref:Unnamed protein product n=1 Tax=Phytophthora fragariaefolia TaxID=1490495 RepID=A0A9W6XQG7_9STRA|nr:unnamed protein product [Phytophthora fragariaefolia]
MIASGNALPPPAYSVVCDIDVGGHAPIKQRARRIPLRQLQKLYELLKGLLKAGLIAISDSPWASPIVIVLKKNGLDFRLCIDYKLVNAVTMIMEYAMPLVDDLLTDLEAYLWFCSLDAASGFWAIMVTMRAPHEDSVTADPVSQLINSPDADMVTTSEADTSTLVPVFDRRSFVDDICFSGKTFDECLATLDRLLSRFEECRISISFTKSIFAQSRVDFLSHDISRDGMRANSNKLTEIAKLPFPKTKKGVQSFLGAINYYGRFIQDFAANGAALYQLKADHFKPGGDLSIAPRSFAALQRKVADAPILRHFDKSKDVHLMLFANEWALIREYNAAADSLAGEALEAKVSNVVLSEERKKELSELNRIQEVIYESSAEEPKTNQPESRNFVKIANGNTSLPRKTFADFVQDEPDVFSVMTRHQKKSRRKRARFAGVRSDSSNEGLAEYEIRPDNSSNDNEATQTSPDNSSEEVQAPADNGAIQTSPDNSNEESQTLPTIPNAEDIDPVAVQNERRGQIAKAQEEEMKWANLTAVLRGNSAKLGYKPARDAWKVMDQFVLSEDEMLYYEGTSRRKRNHEQAEIALRLVVPTTMIPEVLQNCHDSLEGGHQGVVRTYQRVRFIFGSGHMQMSRST